MDLNSRCHGKIKMCQPIGLKALNDHLVTLANKSRNFDR